MLCYEYVYMCVCVCVCNPACVPECNVNCTLYLSMHMDIHTLMHARTHACTHARMHAHTHTHTHTHTQIHRYFPCKNYIVASLMGVRHNIESHLKIHVGVLYSDLYCILITGMYWCDDKSSSAKCDNSGCTVPPIGIMKLA